MDQQTFELMRLVIEQDIADRKKKLMPNKPVIALSQMQRDAGMVGYSQEQLDARDVAIDSAISNYTAGASLALKHVAEREGLTYTPLTPPR